MLRPPSAVLVDVGIRIDFRDLDEWEPEQLAALFDGLAQVVAVQAEQRQAREALALIHHPLRVASQGAKP